MNERKPATMKRNLLQFVGALSIGAMALSGCKSEGPEQPSDNNSMEEPAEGEKTGEKTGDDN